MIFKKFIFNQIAHNCILGRYMIAKRDIEAGEVILRENPLVLGPKITSHVMCLGCHKTIKPPASGDFYKCSKCTWPLCGKNCETLKPHVDECRVMSEKKFKSSIKNNGTARIESSYCVIVPLRIILLKLSNPKAYKTITELTSHLDQRIGTKLYDVLRVNLVLFIRNFLKICDCTERDVLNIAGILDTNSFDIVLPSQQIRGRGVYPMTAMMASECIPNTKHFVDENLEMKVIACVPIKKGEMILTSYTHPLKTTIERRHQLKESKCFDCICRRCNDPTEMKTYASGIKCKICSSGFLITNSDCKWQCIECKSELDAGEVNAVLRIARASLEALNKNSIKECEAFLKKFDSILPPSSVFMVDVKYALSLLYGNVSGYMIEG